MIRLAVVDVEGEEGGILKAIVLGWPVLVIATTEHVDAPIGLESHRIFLHEAFVGTAVRRLVILYLLNLIDSHTGDGFLDHLSCLLLGQRGSRYIV